MSRPWDRPRYERRRQIVNEYKLGKGCADCGYDEHPDALEFDHVRGDKQFNIGANVTVSLAKLWGEIEKCDVVCANCHRIRTAMRRESKVA